MSIERDLKSVARKLAAAGHTDLAKRVGSEVATAAGSHWRKIASQGMELYEDIKQAAGQFEDIFSGIRSGGDWDYDDSGDFGIGDEPPGFGKGPSGCGGQSREAAEASQGSPEGSTESK